MSTVCLYASLQIFKEVGCVERREKSLAMVKYLRTLISLEISRDEVKIITPMADEETGCQTSLLFLKRDINQVADQLRKAKIIIDKRQPNVIRVTPVPLYNTFQEIQYFVKTLARIIKKY